MYSLQISRVLHNLLAGVPGVAPVRMIINIYTSSRRTRLSLKASKNRNNLLLLRCLQIYHTRNKPYGIKKSTSSYVRISMHSLHHLACMWGYITLHGGCIFKYHPKYRFFIFWFNQIILRFLQLCMLDACPVAIVQRYSER